MPAEDTEIHISNRAFDRISRARREGETLSDVIIRLSAATLEGLQRRGEMEVVTSEGKKLVISIDQDKCLGAMSCVTLAPSVFAYDKTEAGLWRRNAEPLGMMEVEKGEVSSETLHLAAESCPYKAIFLKDAETGEQLIP
jgi:ferredoxin